MEYRKLSYKIKEANVLLLEDRDHYRASQPFCILNLFDVEGFHHFYSDEGALTDISINRLWVEQIEYIG